MKLSLAAIGAILIAIKAANGSIVTENSAIQQRDTAGALLQRDTGDFAKRAAGSSGFAKRDEEDDEDEENDEDEVCIIFLY